MVAQHLNMVTKMNREEAKHAKKKQEKQGKSHKKNMRTSENAILGGFKT